MAEQKEKSVDERAVEAPHAATPLKPGKPVEHQALSQMGGSFAERKAAREGKAYKGPKPGERQENSTFASRTKATKAAAKAVKSEDVEDKSVGSRAAKKTAESK